MISKVRLEDQRIFRSIASAPVDERKHLINQFDKKVAYRLKGHLEKLIQQRKGYKITNKVDFDRLKTALKPHAAAVQVILDKKNDRKKGKAVPDPRRGQKGGWIFSLLIGALAPLIVDLISKAISG